MREVVSLNGMTPTRLIQSVIGRFHSLLIPRKQSAKQAARWPTLLGRYVPGNMFQGRSRAKPVDLGQLYCLEHGIQVRLERDSKWPVLKQ